MKIFRSLFNFLLITLCVVFISCGKGYQVRFTNYDTEVMDSVIIGNGKIVFAKTDLQSTTDYRKLVSGNQPVKCITKTKKVYTSTISIPKSGTGKRTIQIDGLNQVSILED